MRKSWEINIHAKGSGGYRFGFKARLAESRGSRLRTRFPLLSRLYDSFFRPETTSNRLKTSSPSTSRSKHHHHSKKPKIPPEPEQLPLYPPKIKTASPNKVTRFTPRSRSLPSSNGKIFFDGSTKPKQDNDNSLGSSILRSVKSLSRSIEERSGSGILIHGLCVTLFACLLLMERFGIMKWRNLVAFLAVAAVAWGVASRNVGSADDSQGSVLEAWKFAASSGSLDQLSQVVFSRIRQAVGL